MNDLTHESIYIEMPVPAKIRQPICTKQDWKDYGPQIAIVGTVFLAALIGLIIFLVRDN